MSDRENQIQGLAKALGAIVPQVGPIAVEWATRLYDNHGVRVEAVVPREPTQFESVLMTALNKHDPALAQRIATASPQQRPAMLAELEAKIPAPLLKVLKEIIGDAA